jgi:hypothetical protein
MKKVMLILLVLIAGCTIIQPTVTAPPRLFVTSTQPTMLFVATETHTPTPLATPESSTRPPLSTKTKEPILFASPESRETLQGLLLTNGGCRFPCYWGIIIPGKTKWEDAWKSLESMADSFEANGKYYVVKFISPNSPDKFYHLGLIVDDGIILRVRGATDKHTIKTFFEEYGVPDEIFLEACGVCREPIDHALFLYYENGIWVHYQFTRDYGYARTKREIELCENDIGRIGFPLYLWDPKLFDMDNHPSKYFHTAWEVKSIKEATGLEPEEFYDAIVNGDGNFCVYSAPEIWYP